MACCCCSRNTCKTILYGTCVIANFTAIFFLGTEFLKDWERQFLSFVAMISLGGSLVLYIIERLENQIKKPAAQAPREEIPTAMPREEIPTAMPREVPREEKSVEKAPATQIPTAMPREEIPTAMPREVPREEKSVEKAQRSFEEEDVWQEGYNAGFGEAGEAYAGDILRLVKKGEQKGFVKGYLYGCDVFEIPAEDPKREAPEMPDSPVAEATPNEEEGDAEDTPDPEKYADGTLQEQTTPPENTDVAINLSL